MTDLVNKRGAWINQYAYPIDALFLNRGKQVDYLIIKHGDEMQGARRLEELAAKNDIPWLGEMFCEENGDPTHQGTRLADQANQEGAIGAVANIEYWNGDRDGTKTLALVNAYRARTTKPLYASVDTRRPHLDYSYQHILAAKCDGVMPMCYPKAFQQTPEMAVHATFNSALFTLWRDKPVIATIQLYDNIGAEAVGRTIRVAKEKGVTGFNAYTLGHATEPEWVAFLAQTDPVLVPTPTLPIPPILGSGSAPSPSFREGLLELRIHWLEEMAELTRDGNVDNVAAFLTYWKGLQNASTPIGK